MFFFHIISLIVCFEGKQTHLFQREVETHKLSVSIMKFAKKGDVDFTKAAKAGLRYLKRFGGGTLEYPAGIFVQGPIEISSSNITIKGAGSSKTRIIRNKDRGYAFLVNNKKNVFIRNLYINCDSSVFEGGIYFGGTINCWGENINVENSDASSCVISCLILDEKRNVRPSSNNGFRNCRVSAQKRYHEVSGKSPFIAGDYAKNSLFQSCTVINSKGDYFDSDNAPGTIFDRCFAINTDGISSSTGFWAEGEQSDSDHKVTWSKCKAVGLVNGFGLSERVKGNIKDCSANSCTHAIRGINHLFRIHINNFLSLNCGEGLKLVETDGVLSFTGPVTLTKVLTYKTLAKYAFCNHAGGDFTLSETILGTGCVFDKDVLISYGNTGSRYIIVDGVRFENSFLRYYNADQTTVLIKRSFFSNGGINGARIKKSQITDGTKFVTSNNGLVAITLNLDNFNTWVNDAVFEGYASIGTNVIKGSNIRIRKYVR